MYIWQGSLVHTGYFERICIYYFYLCVYVCLYECMPCMCGYAWRLERGARSPGIKVIVRYELPDVSAGNQLLS